MPEQPTPEELQEIRIQRMRDMLERLKTMPPGEEPGGFNIVEPLVGHSIAETIIRQIATGYPDAPETKRQKKSRKQAEALESYRAAMAAGAEKVKPPGEPRTAEGWGQIWGGGTPGGGGFF